MKKPRFYPRNFDSPLLVLRNTKHTHKKTKKKNSFLSSITGPSDDGGTQCKKSKAGAAAARVEARWRQALVSAQPGKGTGRVHRSKEESETVHAQPRTPECGSCPETCQEALGHQWRLLSRQCAASPRRQHAFLPAH